MDDSFNPDELFSGGDKKNLGLEEPEFDVVFQQGLLKIALQDDHFCAQLVRYLHEDKDMEQFKVFENLYLQQIFEWIADSQKQFATRPDEGQIRQKIRELDVASDEQEDLLAALDGILQLELHNDQYYRKNLTGFVQQVKFAKGFHKVRRMWKDKTGSAEAYDHMQLVLDGIRRVSFENEDIVTLDDLESLVMTKQKSLGNKIPTGITQLDYDLVGGLPRETLVTVLAGTNVGKSLFCISLGVQALKAKDEAGNNRGFKVLHINLEGRRDEAMLRYISNLSQIPLDKISRGTLDEEEKRKIMELKRVYGPRLKIRNMLGFGVTIEDLVAYCREAYKDFKFDMVIVDYGQLLETKQKTEAHRITMARVFRGLDSIGKEFGAIMITPAQATRGSQENQQAQQFRGKREKETLPTLRSTDISEAMEISRVSGVIITLNMTDEEREAGKLRVFLEKQREGKKGISYGVYTNYDKCDLITGNYYNPKATMNRTQEDKENETMSLDDAAKSEAPPPVSVVEDSQNELDEMVLEYEDLTKKVASLGFDINAENKKSENERNEEFVNGLLQQRSKHKEKLKEIVKKSQELIKITDPGATLTLLSEMEKALKDLTRRDSDASETQILNHERLVKRYKLGLKGKL